MLTDGGGGNVDVINPATGEVIARQSTCDAARVDRAVTSSEQAFNNPEWQSMHPAERGNLLNRLADVMMANADSLARDEMLDTGKPIGGLIGGELPLTAAIIRFYAGAADKIDGSIKSSARGETLMQLYEPYGVVAGILPWNYPFVNAALKVAPAIAAGNAIVLKPSVETPLGTVAFAQLCSDAGLPPGIVNVVTGSGSTTGNALVDHPAVKKVSFTGSTAVGQAIQKRAADQLKMVNLELGGKNALLVFADADLNRAAEAALLSAFANSGQLCVSCSRLLVEESVADAFVALLKEKAAKISMGDPADENTMLGPMITKTQYDTVLAYIELARSEGTIVCGGGTLDLPAPCDQGFWIEPTIVTGIKPGMRVHDEEIFGPVLSVVTFADEAEAVSIANSVEYGLSGAVWTRDGARGLRVSHALDTGIVWVNTMLSGYPQIPVPPHKMSGTGVELGMEGMMAYLKRKSVVVSYDDEAPVGWGLS
jgi:acyl-CoA reductase-like NAD-dependent aldehyde dehydrogenase